MPTIPKGIEESIATGFEILFIVSAKIAKIPNIANAKINGYPSVIKVKPDGTIEEFKNESGESTNAIPNMRDKNEMMKNLMIKPVSANNVFGKNRSNKLRRNWEVLSKESIETDAKEAAEAEEAEKAAEAEEAAKAAEAAEAKKTAEAAEAEEAEEAAKAAEAAEAAETEEKEAAKEAIQEGAKKKNKTKNINIHTGVLTSKDVFETENELIKQRGGRRKKIKSFLSGGTLLKDLHELGKYLKK
jgi:chemotaxis protein histidine kinase CheA